MSGEERSAALEVIRMRTNLAEQTARADAAEARAEILLVQRDAAEEQRDHATRTATVLSAQLQDVYLKTCGWCGGAGHTTDEHNQARPDDLRTPTDAPTPGGTS